jgi:hypothetical protein
MACSYVIEGRRFDSVLLSRVSRSSLLPLGTSDKIATRCRLVSDFAPHVTLTNSGRLKLRCGLRPLVGVSNQAVSTSSKTKQWTIQPSRGFVTEICESCEMHDAPDQPANKAGAHLSPISAPPEPCPNATTLPRLRYRNGTSGSPLSIRTTYAQVAVIIVDINRSEVLGMQDSWRHLLCVWLGVSDGLTAEAYRRWP